MCADLPGRERRFPIPTTKKPDMVVWCEDEKEIHIVKLTEPHENNVAAAHDWKDARYEGLLDEWTEAGWKALTSPSMSGARGLFVGNSVSAV